MLKKIKNYLSNKRLFLAFLFVFIITGLFIPLSNAKADIFGITETFQMILEAVEEQVGPFVEQLIKVFFGYIVGLITLYVSANLLQFAINGQVSWLTINNSALVQSGWRFVAGLSNLFLILIFVIIAIAYILKIETFQAKKALPKLIIVALLMNFSLVFIGILVDISNILYRTILLGNENLIIQFIDSFGAGSLSNLLQLGIWLGALIALWAIPFIGGFAQLAFVILMLAIGGPTIMTWVFQFVLFVMASGLFFTYTFLFAARVFVIQILAIISPLAFLCMVLPQTEKYWKEWLQHLLEWLMLGIILLFFLSLGIRASSQLVPPGGYTPTPILGWGMLQSYFVYYFFVMIYFIIVLFISNKFMPSLAAFVISQATAMGTMAYGRVIKPVTAPLVKGLREGAGAAAERIRQRTASPKMTAWAERQALAQKRWGIVPAAFRRGMGRSMLAAGPEAERQRASKAAGEAEKRDVIGNLSAYRSAAGDQKVGILKVMIDKNQMKFALDENIVGKEKLTDEEVEKTYKRARGLRDNDAIENIEFSFAHLAQKFAEIVDKETADYKPEDRTGIGTATVAGKAVPIPSGLTKKDVEERGYKSYTEKIVDSAKSADDIKKFQKGWWEKSPETMEAAQRFWIGPQLGSAARQFGREFVQEYSKVAEKKSVAWYIVENPRALLYMSGNAAQDLGFRPPKGLTREHAKKLVEQARKRGIVRRP